MDHCLFIQWDIGCQYVDNFELLPVTRVVGIIYSVAGTEYDRMSAFFLHTH